MRQLFLLSAIIAQIFLTAHGTAQPGDAYDHVKGEYIPEGTRWLEVGFFLIVPENWTTVQTTYTNFKDPVVFLSLPNLAGDTSAEGVPMSLRVNNTKLEVVDASTSYYSFEAKSYSVNTTYCSTRHFYTPQNLRINASFIGWLVVERGKYNVSHKGFIIQTDSINRTTKDVREEVNQFTSFAPREICDGGIDCALTSVPSDDLLTIAQIQTINYDTFMLLRGIGIGQNFVVYTLQPHDSLDSAGYFFPDPGENYAWMLFESGLQVTCVEDLAIESYKFRVSHFRLDVTYANTFLIPPALFGMVNTLVGRDSVGLRAFNLDVNTANFITQEDKCEKEETVHVNPESCGVLIVGRTVVGATVCGATFNDNQPTAIPTVSPTVAPTGVPSTVPSGRPTGQPSGVPSGEPSGAPTVKPTGVPSFSPTGLPSSRPSGVPSGEPSGAPTVKPTGVPSGAPSTQPSGRPSGAPSGKPSGAPTVIPTGAPTGAPTGRPSQGPTGVPTIVPTGRPTDQPTGRPNAAPTGIPAGCPTGVPTSKPTPTPTVEPTFNPTRRPTFRPTRAPTRVISNESFCVEVTLYDTFGDGWGDNIALEVSGGVNDTFYIFYDECSAEANMTDRQFPRVICYPPGEEIYFDIVTFEPPATESWEIYWTVRTLGQVGTDLTKENTMFTPEFFVGDFDTNMTVFEDEVDVFNPVDYFNQTCKRCKHPPKPKAVPKAGRGPKGMSASTTASEGESLGKTGPKTRELHSHTGTESTEPSVSNSSSVESAGGKGEGLDASKPKPKPPHWPFPLTLLDTDGTGWFNGSEVWVKVPQYHCDGSVEFFDDRRLPEVLTSPEYVISTIDRVHDLRRNTICGDLLKETCEERLPDGKYIFRVGGALSNDNAPDTAKWDFCGVKGNSMEELQFTLVKGKCFPGDKISALELCCSDISSIATFTGSLVLSNVASAALTAYDTKILEFGLAEALMTVHDKLHTSILLTSWEVSGSELTVYFRMSIDPSYLGIIDTEYAVLDSLASEMLTAAQLYMSNGHFLHTLQSRLSEMALGEEDVLSDTSVVSLSKLEYLRSAYTHDEEVAAVSQSSTVTVVAAASVDASVSSDGVVHATTLSYFKDALIPIVLVVCGIILVGAVSTAGSSALKTNRFDKLSRIDAALQEESTSSRTEFMSASDNSEIPNFA